MLPLQQHVLVLPFPAQGHVNPLMNLSHKLAQHGCKVTFVNSEFNHKRVVRAMMNKQVNLEGYEVELVSIPDGLEPEADRNDVVSLILSVLSTMPCALEKLIRNINAVDGGSKKITCIIADLHMAWALQIAQKVGIKGALINPSAAALAVFVEHIHKFIEDGVMDTNGFPLVKGKFQLTPGMPMIDPAEFSWYCFGDTEIKKTVHHLFSKMTQYTQLADWWLSNTTSELESGALSLCPKLLPIGPLMESPKFRSLGQFWEEDLSCLSWLDQHPPCSVIYVAFGSFTIFDPNQFKELALGLELTNRPFLWVVREDDENNSTTSSNKYPSEFQGTKGKIIKWAPQNMVLGHPATACFISHCGWNSTLDGLSNGVPFLCWPYFSDQPIDKAYICDVWKVGLGFDLDDNGLISRWEIKNKVEQLLADQSLRDRSQKHKEMITDNITEGGKSSENFNKFMEWLKKE